MHPALFPFSQPKPRTMMKMMKIHQSTVLWKHVHWAFSAVLLVLTVGRCRSVARSSSVCWEGGVFCVMVGLLPKVNHRHVTAMALAVLKEKRKIVSPLDRKSVV